MIVFGFLSGIVMIILIAALILPIVIENIYSDNSAISKKIFIIFEFLGIKMKNRKNIYQKYNNLYMEKEVYFDYIDRRIVIIHKKNWIVLISVEYIDAEYLKPILFDCKIKEEHMLEIIKYTYKSQGFVSWRVFLHNYKSTKGKILWM